MITKKTCVARQKRGISFVCRSNRKKPHWRRRRRRRLGLALQTFPPPPPLTEGARRCWKLQARWEGGLFFAGPFFSYNGRAKKMKNFFGDVTSSCSINNYFLQRSSEFEKELKKTTKQRKFSKVISSCFFPWRFRLADRHPRFLPLSSASPSLAKTAFQ